MAWSRPLLLPALLAAAPCTAQEPPPAIARALQQLDAQGAPGRLRALRELERAGERAVPALLQALEQRVRDQPRATVHSQPLFLSVGGDDLLTSLDDIAMLWPLPAATMFFELEDAAGLREQSDERRRELAAVDGEDGVRLRLLFLLLRAGAHAAPAVPLLVDLLAHEDLGFDAACVLVAIGPSAAPPLLAALGDRVRGFAAAETLAALQRGRPPALVRDPVTGLLADRQCRDRGIATLAHLGPLCGREQATAVAGVARRAGGVTARYCAWALGRIGAAAAPELQSLLREDLGPPRHNVLLGAAMLLGPAAKALTPEVLALRADGLPGIAAANALAAIAPASPQEGPVVELLLRQCVDGKLIEQAAAVRALGAFPGRAVRSVPVLTRIVQEESYLLRRLAVESLAALGSEAAPASAALLQVVAQEGTHVDPITLATLAQLGAVDVDEARRDAAAWQERFDLAIRAAAVRALGASDRNAVGRLVGWLADERLSEAAADALVAVGRSVVAALVPLLADDEAGAAAARVLARIDGPGLDALLAVLGGDEPAAGHAEDALQWTDAEVDARLIQLLRNGHERQRDGAARVLAARDLSALKSRDAETLIAAARAAEPERRADLVAALETIESERVVAFLILCTADADGEVRARAVTGLGYYHDVDGDDVRKALAKALWDPLASVRAAAAEAFAGSAAEDPAVRDRLLELRDDDLVEVRAAALAALGAFGGSSEQVLPVLAGALSDPSAGVRAGALRGLAGLGVRAVGRLDDVLRALRDQDEEVRTEAAMAVGALRPDLAAASQALAELVSEDEPLLGGARGGRPGQGQPPVDAAALDALRAGLTANDVRAIQQALAKVLALGSKAAPLRSPVEELLGHPDAEVRAQAVNALWALLGEEAATPFVQPLLRDPAPPVRAAVVGLLRRAAVQRTAAAIAAITPLASDADRSVRIAVYEALGSLAAGKPGPARDVEPTLVGGLADPETPVRAAAAAALGRLPVVGAATVAALTARLGEHDGAALQAAVAALGAVGTAAAAPAVPRLLELARSGGAELRSAALAAAARIAPDQPDVLLLAVAMLQDEPVAAAARMTWKYRLLPR